MTELRGQVDLTDESAIQLYEKYLDSIRSLRAEQRDLCDRRLVGQLDDIEAELLYLQIRERRPRRVVEIGALRGASTTWLLCALRDNGAGRLLTIDFADEATPAVPHGLSHRRWSVRRADAGTWDRDWVTGVEHLFIDPVRSRRFARWYLSEVLPELTGGAQVSVHDVFRRRRPLPWTGSSLLVSWLDRRGLRPFTASRAAAPDAHERIMQFRMKAGLAQPGSTRQRDAMVFFRIEGPSPDRRRGMAGATTSAAE